MPAHVTSVTEGIYLPPTRNILPSSQPVPEMVSLARNGILDVIGLTQSKKLDLDCANILGRGMRLDGSLEISLSRVGKAPGTWPVTSRRKARHGVLHSATEP